MTMLARHLLSQRRAVGALGQVMLDALSPARAGAPSAVPGREVQVRIEPPGEALIADYLSNVGGVRGGYLGTIPPHLFPHWAFGPLVQCLRSTRYPLLRALNVGCRLQMNARLSSSHALDISARLLEVRDEGGRVVLHARVTTGQAAYPEALVADLFALVPRRRTRRAPNAGAEPEREKPSVPAGAHALERFSLERSAGLRFALLTGDLNPIHWLGPYARAAGFSGPILHGFALLARSFEGLVRSSFDGDPERLHRVDVRFTRPLPLPAEVTLYAERDALYVGERPGTTAFMAGTFSGR
jgi:acyl dehydratase